MGYRRWTAPAAREVLGALRTPRIDQPGPLGSNVAIPCRIATPARPGRDGPRGGTVGPGIRRPPGRPPAPSPRVVSAMRVLSGIQPSGALHIGNYFGAIRQYIALQDGNDAFYFVANYHALTSVRDAEAAPRLRLRRVRRPARPGAGPRAGDAVRPVGRARDDRAGLAADERHADGLAGEVRQLQGQGPARAPRRARPLRLPGAPGGRHPALRRRRGPGRPGPEAAPGDHPRHRRAVQPRLRRRLRGLPAAQAVHPRRGGRRARGGRAEDVEELPQHDRDLRRPGRDPQEAARRSSPTARRSRPRRIPRPAPSSGCSASSPRPTSWPRSSAGTAKGGSATAR